MTHQTEVDGFAATHPTPAASSEAKVIKAARVIAKHSPMPTERGEAEELIFWMEGTNQ